MEHKSKMAPKPRKAGYQPDTFDTPTPVTCIPLHLRAHPKPTTTRLPKVVVNVTDTFEDTQSMLTVLGAFAILRNATN